MQETTRNFAVARTDRKWHLDLQFLVPKNAFDEEELADSLGLPPWDEIEGLLHYGRGARVRIGTRAIRATTRSISSTLIFLRLPPSNRC